VASLLASLLASLRKAGAHEQAAALAARAAAHADLDNPGGVAVMLERLQEAGADDQAAALTGRLPAAGMFELFLKQQGPADRFRFGREADGTPAAPWDWEDLDLWLIPDRGDREATLPVGLPPTRRIRKVSLDTSLSGRPELHCEAQLSAPAPRSHHLDRTPAVLSGARCRCPDLPVVPRVGVQTYLSCGLNRVNGPRRRHGHRIANRFAFTDIIAI
jgi:hypothetical protein